METLKKGQFFYLAPMVRNCVHFENKILKINSANIVFSLALWYYRV